MIYAKENVDKNKRFRANLTIEGNEVIFDNGKFKGILLENVPAEIKRVESKISKFNAYIESLKIYKTNLTKLIKNEKD